jgi:hypothetical protein
VGVLTSSKAYLHLDDPSWSSLPYILHTCAFGTYLFGGGGIYLTKKIIRWWYVTCKKLENIICDGILHVNMFHCLKSPTLYVHFYKIYLQWIYWTLFFIACCSTIFASQLPEDDPLMDSTWTDYNMLLVKKIQQPRACYLEILRVRTHSHHVDPNPMGFQAFNQLICHELTLFSTMPPWNLNLRMAT